MELILNNGHLTAIASSSGGELISLKDPAGQEYLWQGDPAYWSGRNPNLFPIVGGLKDGSVCIDGTVRQMKRHGFARNSEFSVCEQGKDFAVFELTENESTLQMFPFPFRLRICHRLLPDGFSTQFSVTNTGSGLLPFCIGAHTAFNCPMNGHYAFEDHKLVFNRPEDRPAMVPDATGCLDRNSLLSVLQGPDTVPLDHRVFERVDTLIFEGLNSDSVSLLDPDGHGVRMEFSQFPMIAFWTNGAGKAPFLCLEPWHGCGAYADETGRFRDKPHCIQLQPGQTKNLTYTVTLL